MADTGLVKFESGKPMAFEFVGLPAKDRPPDDDPRRRVTRTIRAYLQTGRELSATRYAQLADKIPAHLRSPGNVLVTFCSDGIIARYDIDLTDGPHVVASMSADTVTDAMLQLSEGAVFLGTDDELTRLQRPTGLRLLIELTDGATGNVKTLQDSPLLLRPGPIVQEPNTASRSMRPRPKFQVSNDWSFKALGDQVNNDGTGFIWRFEAESITRLGVGWQCLEVHEAGNFDLWDETRAPLWAEIDILAAVVEAFSKSEQAEGQDPWRRAREFFAALLEQYTEVLNDAKREEELQTFLEKHPYLLWPHLIRARSKVPFGRTVSDLVIQDAVGGYILVELEKPGAKLFRSDGHLGAALTHAQGRIADWRRYISDNQSTVQRELGLSGITSNLRSLIVIGRSAGLSAENRRKLDEFATTSPSQQILTYDDILVAAKATLENLLGPMEGPTGANLRWIGRTVPIDQPGASFARSFG